MVSDELFHGLFWVLLGGLMLVRVLSVVQVRMAGSRFTPDRQAIEREGWANFALRFIAFFILIGVLVAFAIDPAWMRALDLPVPAPARWAAFIVGILGIGLAFWAQVVIGQRWSAQLQLTEGHRVISTGPYAHIRHPIYAALVAISIALAVVTANWLFIGFGALSIVMSLVRIPREERMMLEGVPGYAEYASKVRSRLIPGAW